MARVLSGLLAGVGVGVVAGLVGLLLTGPGGGSPVPAVVLFPFPRVLGAFVRGSVVIAAGAALLQYPIYGAVTGLFSTWGRGIAVVCAVHVAAVALALYFLGLMTF